MGIRSISSKSIKNPGSDLAARFSPLRLFFSRFFKDRLTVSNRKKIVKAVIPAAGFGTRMLPATKAVPKEMLPVAGKPLIQYAVEEAVASGIETVIVVTRDDHSLIPAHFARDRELESFLDQQRLDTSTDLLRPLPELVNLQYVHQRNPLGLAHAVSCARPLVGEEPFVVLLPDVIMINGEPVTSQIIRAHEEMGGSVVTVREVEPSDVVRFGIVRVDRSVVRPSSRSVRITGLVEKPSADHAPSRLGVFGRYLLEPSIWKAIAQTPPDSRGEVQLTDALNLLCQKESLFGLCFEGQHYDAGDPMGYLKANIELSLRDPRLGPPLLEYLSSLPL
jgi:UTP--glucose-1-phosphate uridylyltransferase